MPNTNVNPSYTLHLTGAEFRLVTMALAGMLEDDQDVQEALKLNTHLCTQRARQLKDAAEVAAKAMESAEEIQKGQT